MATKTSKTKVKRQYSDEDKANALLALEANGGNLKRTATQLKIPMSSLRDWRENRGTPPSVLEIREEKRGPLAERLEDIAHKIVDGMPNAIAGANLQQQAMAVAIMVDKAQLLQGKPTGINENRGDSPADIAARVGEILQAAKDARQKDLGLVG